MSGAGPMADGIAVQSRREREVYCESGIGQNLALYRASVGARMIHVLSHSHPRPLSLSLLLWTAIPSAIGPAPDIYPISLSLYLSLSLFYFGAPIHLPLARFLAYRHSFPIGQSSPLDSYITAILLR
jgi:hypothetical protein